jgi:hypothetical protein
MNPTMKRLAVFVWIGMVAMMLAGCNGVGGGSGDPPTPPPAPSVTVAYGVKSVVLSWEAVNGATHYQVFRDPDGVSGFIQIGGNQASTSCSDTLALHLKDWVNVRYKVTACNSAGNTDSNVITGLDLLQAVGYFKSSNNAGIHGNCSGQFGATVALSADGATMAVGAIFEDSDSVGVDGDQLGVFDGFNAGAVYIFTRTGTTWAQQAYVKASNTGGGDVFGWSLSLSADGDTLAVSAIGDDSAAVGIDGDDADNTVVDSGAVYIFTRAGTAWSQQAYVKPSNTDSDDVFGITLALSTDGGTLAVGAMKEDSGATGIDGNDADNTAVDSGAVYIFTRAGTAWSQQAYVKSSLAGDTWFGQSVGLSGDGETLAVGSFNSSASANGAVSVFTRSGAVWTEQTRLLASNDATNIVGLGTAGTVYYGLGSPLALSADGDTLAAGAYAEYSAATGVNGNQTDATAQNAGAVYVFTRTGTTWSQQAYVKASNTGQGDSFGANVALSASGDTLAVGAPYEGSIATGVNGDEADNTNGFGTGAAYIFTRTGAAWAQQTYVKPSNTHPNPNQFFYFGISVALSSGGDSLAVGAFTEDSAATGVGGDQTDVSAAGAGAVYLY